MIMKIKKEICQNIFRGYDIRGIYEKEIDEDTAYTIGLGFGSHIKSIGKTTCIIGQDNRLSSPSLCNALKKGILDTGIDIVFLGTCTTPMYYYACIKLKIYSGIMVTASHNPKEDNGFKFAFDESGNCKGQEIQDFMNYILKGDFASGKGKETNYSIEEEYLELFKKSLSFGDKKIKVVIDPANGTTSVIVKKIYSLFPIETIYINEESDGSFPNHHPDPCVEKNLEQLKRKVLEEKADIGLSFDGDGDRMGLVTNTAKFVPTDQYMIVIIRDLIDKVEKKTFLYDVKCSKAVEDEIRNLGGKGICYRTGNSYTKAKVKEENLPFGGELSGHVYFRDRWPGFDSGLYAGLRILELLSKTGKTVDELIEDIPYYYATEELKFKSPDERKFKVIAKVEEYAKEKKYNFLDIDGIKVLFDDGWALVRASNTGPNLTARFEAKTKERLEEIQNEFINLIDQLNK